MECAISASLSVSLGGCAGKVTYQLDKIGSVLKLNVKGIVILSVTCQNELLQYSLMDLPLTSRLPGSYTKTNESSQDGELHIIVPPHLQSTDELSVSIVIEYETRCIYSTLGDTEHGQFPHVLIHPSSGQARYWIPCFDSMDQKCTLDVLLSIPNTIGHALLEVGQDISSISPRLLDLEWTAVSGLDLLETFLEESSLTRTVHHFTSTAPIPLSSVSFAIGPFKKINVSEHALHLTNGVAVPDPGSDPLAISNGKVEIYSLVGFEELIVEATWWLPKALEFFETWIGVSFPFTSMTFCFVDHLASPILTSAGMALVSLGELGDFSLIDIAYETRLKLAAPIASQWFGQFVSARTWADAWLSVGLSRYIASQYLRRSLGNNEYRYRLKTDMERICDLDVSQPPLCPASWADDDGIPKASSQPFDPTCIQFFTVEDAIECPRAELILLKSPLILHMLAVRLGKGILQKVVNKLMIAAISGDLHKGLGTRYFLRLCSRLSGKLDLKDFGDQWIFGCGSPTLHIVYFFNRKKTRIELWIKQENLNKTSDDATPKFTGAFTVRVQEPGGTFDTEIRIEDVEKKVCIAYHTKYRRIKRRPNKKSKKEGEESDEDEDDFEIDGFDPAEMPKPDEPNRVAVAWVTVDPELQWAGRVILVQDDFMWYSRLRKEKDVMSQLDSVHALADMKNSVSANLLMSVYQDTSNFYKLRIEAIQSLARLTGQETEVANLHDMLIKSYRDMFGTVDPTTGRFLPHRNNFDSYQTYFLQHALIAVMPDFCDASGWPPTSIRRLLMDLLELNDNAGNKYDDCFLLCRIITSLGDSFLPHQDPGRSRQHLQAQAETEVPVTLETGDIEEFDISMSSSSNLHRTTDVNEAYFSPEDRDLFRRAVKRLYDLLAKDRLAPSFRNVITVACLETLLKWQLSGLLTLDVVFFLRYLNPLNWISVRQVAFDAILLLAGLDVPETLEVVVDIATHDLDSQMKYKAMKSLSGYVSICRGYLKQTFITELQKTTFLDRLSNLAKRLNESISYLRVTIASMNHLGSGTVSYRL